MIEALGHVRYDARYAALDFISDNECYQKLLGTCANVLGGREHRTEIVTGMAETAWRDKAVQQIDIADDTAGGIRRGRELD